MAKRKGSSKVTDISEARRSSSAEQAWDDAFFGMADAEWEAMTGGQVDNLNPSPAWQWEYDRTKRLIEQGRYPTIDQDPFINAADVWNALQRTAAREPEMRQIAPPARSLRGSRAIAATAAASRSDCKEAKEARRAAILRAGKGGAKVRRENIQNPRKC